jgi:hypothetical protein
VHAGIEQLLHGDDGHGCPHTSFVWRRRQVCRGAGGCARHRVAPPLAPAPPPGPAGLWNPAQRDRPDAVPERPAGGGTNHRVRGRAKSPRGIRGAYLVYAGLSGTLSRVMPDRRGLSTAGQLYTGRG